MAGFHIVVQQDYAKSWANQKAYWRQVMKHAPDIQQGTQVFVLLKERLPETKYILTHSWADYMLLDKFYDTRSAPKDQKPKVNIISSGNVNSFRITNGRLERLSWRPKPGGGFHREVEILDPNRIIFLLGKKDGSMIRLSQSVTLGKLRIPLPPPGEKTDFPPTTLYHLIMD